MKSSIIRGSELMNLTGTLLCHGFLFSPSGGVGDNTGDEEIAGAHSTDLRGCRPGDCGLPCQPLLMVGSRGPANCVEMPALEADALEFGQRISRSHAESVDMDPPRMERIRLYDSP